VKNALFAALVGFLTICFCGSAARAQGTPLPLGTIHRVTQLSSCPSGFSSGMTCFHGQMSCPNTVDIGFTYGSEIPSHALRGTIVFFAGGDGTSPEGNGPYATTYLAHGYHVVELAWDTAWEDTLGGSGTSTKDAACRPATFLNFAHQSLYRGGGMCAQGGSAGSAAVAYSLAWYGSSNFLDNAELLSGPVLSDVEQGCKVPNAPITMVCPTGELGCNGAAWPDSPAYVQGDQVMVGQWSGDAACNAGQVTSNTSNLKWKAMSIIDGTTNPSFLYPKTALAGWLCSNVTSIQNNSAAQGEFFYQQFTASGQTAGFSVTRIDHCDGPEGVDTGQTPQGVMGFIAITDDMVANCIRRHP